MKCQFKTLTATLILFLIIQTSIPFSIADWESEFEGEVKVEKQIVQILSYSISSGEFRAEENVSANVTIKNIGDSKWTFYAGFSVQDPNGEWWDAPYEEVTLNPGEIRTFTLYWIVDTNAPLGLL